MEQVLREAKKNRTAMEINAYPLRLDLDDSAARRAAELGVPLVINTDTHAISQLDSLGYGVAVGRRAWLEKGDVLNTLEVDGLLKRLKGGKRGKGLAVH